MENHTRSQGTKYPPFVTALPFCFAHHALWPAAILAPAAALIRRRFRADLEWAQMCAALRGDKVHLLIGAFAVERPVQAYGLA